MNKSTALKIDFSNFWQKVSEKVQATSNAGIKPILIIDLDGTLVDYTMRTYMIFKKALSTLDISNEVKQKVEDIKREDYDYFPRSNFERADIGDVKIIDELTSFWEKHYFTNHYLKYDRQMPGAYKFISNILELGINIVYLTGRDEPNMGDGTKAWLEQQGFLKDSDPRCRLLMKTNLEIENYESKERNGKAIGDMGQPVLIIDNEPIELQTMWERFPGAIPVLMDMPNSGKPAKLPDDIFMIKDFLQLNAGFKN